MPISAATVIYLFDPLCGWCYGASPMIDRILAAGVAVDFVPTGLFSGAGARRIDPGMTAHIWAADERISRLSSQPFTEPYRQRVLGATGARLDSAAATRGVVAAGLSEPIRRFAALKSLQHARYAEGRDIVSEGGVAGVLADVGIEDAAALLRAPDEVLLAAERDLVTRGKALFDRLGANGVPALAVINKDRSRLLGADALYGPLENLLPQIEAA